MLVDSEKNKKKEKLINIDFIALGAFCIYSYFEIEIAILNMMEMLGSHTAEVIKEASEQMINQFEFDKSKIHGN